MLTTTGADSGDYLEHFEMLVQIARSEYELPDDDAEAIAHDILLASMRHAPANLPEWLTGAMIYAVQRHRTGDE